MMLSKESLESIYLDNLGLLPPVDNKTNLA